MRHVESLEEKITACSHRLLAWQNEYDDMKMENVSLGETQTSQKKRKYAQLVADNEIVSDQSLQSARLAFIEHEMKKEHGIRENHRRELSVFEKLLDEVKRGNIRQIFALEEEILAVDAKIQSISKEASSKIVEQTEEACEILGWIERDEFFAASVSKKGLGILLQHHQLLIPGPELEQQWQMQEEVRLRNNVMPWGLWDPDSRTQEAAWFRSSRVRYAKPSLLYGR